MLIDRTDLAALPTPVRAALDKEQRRFELAYGGIAERRVLLIGGSGYVGGAVTRQLLAQGVQVRNLDCLVYHHGSASLGFLGHPRYEFHFGGMGNPDKLSTALEGVTDVVLLAGLVGDPITRAFPDQAQLINDEAVRTCIDRLNGHRLNKVIFVSTCSNYGMIADNEIATEESALKPLSLYAKSKVAAEQYLLSLANKIDYAPTILRFATAFGLAPRMRFDLTVNEFTRELFLDSGLVVYDAATWRPYCHVRDFARLIGAVLEYPIDDVGFEVFNAGGDESNHTKQSIVELIRGRLPDRRVTYRDNSDDPRNYRVSFEKVRTRLHFVPRVSVAEGIDEIIWALSMHMFDDVPVRRNFYGNHALPGLNSTADATAVPTSHNQPSSRRSPASVTPMAAYR